MKATFFVSCAALFTLIPSGVALRCYTCLFPTISPLDCLKFPTPCGPSQQCLTSVARGHRGALELVIQEKSCGDPSMCWAHGTRSMLGANFTYSTSCCSTDLCNRGAGGLGTSRGLLTVSILSVVMVYLC
ncbi:CD59 glycoprotein-like [Heteronotia binoei]|uniref:CD59 glycoprotein-like n=1 Tax=Heteronotia binoei TaxID=13085 RepID=UPI00293083B8|nr:CD59 glycoprotein-like [Heteronotia binoei]